MITTRKIYKNEIEKIFAIYLLYLKKSKHYDENKVSFANFEKIITKDLESTYVGLEKNEIVAFLTLNKSKVFGNRRFLAGPFYSVSCNEDKIIRFINSIDCLVPAGNKVTIEGRSLHRSRQSEIFLKSGFAKKSDLYVLRVETKKLKSIKRVPCKLDCSIVNYNPEDKEQLIALLNKTIRDECGGAGFCEDYIDEVEKTAATKSIFVVKHQAEVVGFLIIFNGNDEECEIIIGADKSVRHSGIMQNLIREVYDKEYSKYAKAGKYFTLAIRDNGNKKTRAAKKLYSDYYGFEQTRHYEIYEKELEGVNYGYR